MAKPFEVPWTMNDEDESGFGMWYLTRSEFGLALLSVIIWYMLFLPLFIALHGWKYANLLHGTLSIICVLWFITWMTNYKRGKPTSWLWDALLALGTLPEQRGLMKNRRGIRWLSMLHLAKPSVFVAGAKKAGEDLTISAAWMTIMPPIVEWAPLILPRRRRLFSDKPSPAPVWFYGANGFADVVNARIPVTVEYIVVTPVLKIAA
jgi:conjugative transfer region protein (TIGR03750 family)